MRLHTRITVFPSSHFWDRKEQCSWSDYLIVYCINLCGYLLSANKKYWSSYQLLCYKNLILNKIIFFDKILKKCRSIMICTENFFFSRMESCFRWRSMKQTICFEQTHLLYVYEEITYICLLRVNEYAVEVAWLKDFVIRLEVHSKYKDFSQTACYLEFLLKNRKWY